MTFFLRTEKGEDNTTLGRSVASEAVLSICACRLGSVKAALRSQSATQPVSNFFGTNPRFIHKDYRSGPPKSGLPKLIYAGTALLMPEYKPFSILYNTFSFIVYEATWAFAGHTLVFTHVRGTFKKVSVSRKQHRAQVQTRY